MFGSCKRIRTKWNWLWSLLNIFFQKKFSYWIFKVVNLRTLRPLDEEIFTKSVKKTHHLISVEFGWPQCGIGSEIIARICESKLK